LTFSPNLPLLPSSFCQLLFAFQTNDLFPFFLSNLYLSRSETGARICERKTCPGLSFQCSFLRSPHPTPCPSVSPPVLHGCLDPLPRLIGVHYPRASDKTTSSQTHCLTSGSLTANRLTVRPAEHQAPCDRALLRVSALGVSPEAGAFVGINEHTKHLHYTLAVS